MQFFREILRIPRESGHEEHIIEYLLEFGRSRGLDTKRDTIGNVLITKPAANGCEKWPTVVLQSHQDMVSHACTLSLSLPLPPGTLGRSSPRVFGSTCPLTSKMDFPAIF